MKRYYGEVLRSQKDLKTSACCVTEAPPAHLREALALIHPEIQSKFYGCGSPIPSAIEGKTVLDLGCGTGRDCYVLSKLVGASGSVIGVDMTDAQLEVASRHEEYHRERFGYSRSNTRFLKGYIEDLEALGIASSSVDVVTSNCVLNLSPDKPRVFSEIFRVLKPGGELYFSDVFADRRIPSAVAEDPTLRGECLGGALYLEDFRRLLAELGCRDYRIISSRKLTIGDPALWRKAGMIGFHSVTVRAFKLELEDRCEDYGQLATYLGTIPEAPHELALDAGHVFKKGRPASVCGNTAEMLSKTRYAAHFEITGDRSIHHGLFDCGAAATVSAAPVGSCC